MNYLPRVTSNLVRRSHVSHQILRRLQGLSLSLRPSDLFGPEWRRLSLQRVSLGVIVAPLADGFYAVFKLPARFAPITETAANECGDGGWGTPAG
jgi:hypothetical protein